MKKVMIGLLLAGVFTSCKKDDKKCDFNQANFAGTYKVTSVIYKADASTSAVDEFTTWDACEKDDLVIFNTNGTVTYQDAGTVCTPDGNDTGIWAYVNSSTVIIDGDNATVSDFSCSGMKVTFSDLSTGESNAITLVKQ